MIVSQEEDTYNDHAHKRSKGIFVQIQINPNGGCWERVSMAITTCLLAIINTHCLLILPSYSSRKSCFHKTWLVSKLSHCCKYLFRKNIHNSYIIYTPSSLMTPWRSISSSWFFNIIKNSWRWTIPLAWHSLWQTICIWQRCLSSSDRVERGVSMSSNMTNVIKYDQCHLVWPPHALLMRVFPSILVERKTWFTVDTDHQSQRPFQMFTICQRAPTVHSLWERS